ncbi:polygalacturonase-like [Agrilus planipennis]|uniref:endo-polygalacturonase n=1 Tax=Agrilus planipennis TaxID=224129 RepID=A0A1W4WC92_AGRPL|nr:polygalacturonase-like [Agrilus planipennis]
MEYFVKFHVCHLFLLLSTLYVSAFADSSCTLTGNSIDNLENIKSSCKNIIVDDLLVPAGLTLDFTGISDVNIEFRGNTSFEFKIWKGPLILISGNNVNVSGAEDSVIDGNGPKWWDTLGDKGITKPRLFKLRYLTNANVTNLSFLNSPRHCFAIHNCTNITINNVVINDKSGDTQGGKNTDGFNVKGSENVYITNVHVFNQDDCLAVRSGNNIHFSNGHCYKGHGLSIGSIGNRTNNVVQNVYISNSQLVESDIGVRIKTVWNCTGLVTGIHYDNITLIGIKKYGIIFHGNYGKLPSPNAPLTDGIPIKDITLNNIQGTVVTAGTNIYVNIAEGVGSDWDWRNVNITGGEKKRSCHGIPKDSNAFCA